MIFQRFILLCFSLLPFTLPAQDRFSDCAGAIILCDKSDLIVKQLFGVGQELSEVGFTTCSDRLKERNTVWLKWQVGAPGAIEFTIEPLESGDDLDFIVYRLDDDILQCSRKYELRCMASGENIGDRAGASSACTGKMGLSDAVSDLRESDGCGDDHDNFLAAIDAKAGENYILYVNNYTSANGFRLEWGGDATFTKPRELEMPLAQQTRMSKAIYFRDNAAKSGFKTDWTEAPLQKAFVATAGGSSAPNVFAGCTPFDDNIEKSARREAFRIGALYPNPATTQTNVRIEAPHSAVMQLEVCDVLGKRCYDRVCVLDPGEQLLQIPVQQLSAGFYFVQLRAGKTVETKKLMVAY